MSLRSRWLVRAFAFGGLIFAAWASLVHYRLLTDPTYISPCDINAKFNCSQLYLSRYGSVLGVPVALGGVFWFTIVLLLAWLGPLAGSDTAQSSPATGPASRVHRRNAESVPPDAIDGYLFVLATIGLATILYLGYASYQLRTVCLLCVGTYVCVIGIFVTVGLSTSNRVARLPLRLFEDLRYMTSRPIPLLVSILFIAGAVSLIAYFPKEGAIATAAQAPQAQLSNDLEVQFRDAWSKQPRKDLGIPANGAKVTIVKFNDWLCPVCRTWHQVYKPLLDRYMTENPGSIKYVVKDFLWNSRCNPFGGSIRGHEGACEAAAAVRMARDRGKADEMIAWLFDNQERLVQLGLGAPDPQASSNPASVSIKQQTLKMLGLTAADFDHEYSAKLPDMKRDEADGKAAEVGGTPTYFVNGIRADANGPLPVPYFELAIKIELNRPQGGR